MELFFKTLNPISVVMTTTAMAKKTVSKKIW